MAARVSEGLRGLCRVGGWTYGALWRLDGADPRLLVLEESYHEDPSESIFEKMIRQVHLVGQGTIGEAAVSGRNQWIDFGAHAMESSLISPTVKADLFQENTEWKHHILGGIKTVAVISLHPRGVVQFGSTQKICESSEFIAQAQHLLQQPEIKQHGYVDFNFSYAQATYASIVSSMATLGNKSSIYLQNDICKQKQEKVLRSGSLSGLHHLFQRTPSISNASSNVTTNQQSALTDPSLVFPSDSGLQSKFECLSKSSAMFFKSNSSSKETDSLYFSKQKIHDETANAVVFDKLSTSHFPVHCSDASGILFTTSALSHRAGKLLDLKHCCSSPPSIFGLSCGKSSMKVSPIPSELPESFLASPRAQNIRNSLTIPSTNEPTHDNVHDESMNNQIHSCEQTNEQVNAGHWKESNVNAPTHVLSDDDLFDGIELDLSPTILRHNCWDDVVSPIPRNCFEDMNTDLSDCISEIDMCSAAVSGRNLFSDSCLEQLLDAVMTGNTNLSASCNSGATQESRHQVDHISVSGLSSQIQTPPVPFLECNLKSHAQALIGDRCSINADGFAHNQPKKQEAPAKIVRKRARPGESTCSRPKDRQQIQDRIKELREIVPDCTKCSIDALLDRTIRHMLFLQSVTKYADKLKQAEEPKMIGEENGVVLRDNSNGGGGGATWAYEVAGQTMVCPILVENVHPTGQLHVEMLCEEQGFFLEIADIIRGFGLIILKGLMEVRDGKVWARFLVEQANRNVTRMDIFLSLVELLHQTSSIRSADQLLKSIDSGIITSLSSYQQSSGPLPICLADRSAVIGSLG